ncbi:hypothetical protein [Actinoplanes sp. NBRC 103695]|uniref:WXG100 family type VII secretion target n=1 Tax=Actinoplanes sp. NBRC 103695 TaxID=3032202 RepID=UPI0024A406C4|nr:hypothetical protein [Actinoplanes sp. NBRC 103695]GLY98419.1 hypothetical protein Acsp02_56730 [Actinoplanes sp. NBRC 103695]
MSAADNPLVATPAEDGPAPWAGIWIAEDIEQIVLAVRNGSWIDGTLGVVGAGLDGLALVSDPAGALLQYGIAWLIEHVRPLSEALDWLAGDPAQIAAHAQTWRNVAASVRDEAEELLRSVRWDVEEWTGAAGDAYRAHADFGARRLQTLGTAADGMALMTEGAGVLIGTVRIMVRDAVATVVSRLIVYAGELLASLGAATPLVVEQVATLCASWGAKIARWLRGLIASLRKLAEAMRGLGKGVDDLNRMDSEPSGGGPGSGGSPGSSGGGPVSRPPWTARDDIAGPARGKDLLPPHPRHTLSGVRSGEVGKVNSVILRGNEAAVRGDIEQIAAGNAAWLGDQGRYEINGRTYGIESAGRVYPDAGPGIARLDRNEYAALKEIAIHHGDVGAVRAFRQNPRFLENPEVIAKAKAIYDGTWAG